MPRRLGRCSVAVAVFLVAGSASGSASLRRTLELNISRAAAGQNEVTIAVDPGDPQTLLAGSISGAEPAMRTYASTDGGATWSSRATPATFPGESPDCPTHPGGDPAVGIDRTGRQYFAFLATKSCTNIAGLFVASRPGPGSPWSLPVEIVPAPVEFAVDKPVLAVDTAEASANEGRVYVAFQGLTYDLALVSSDDGGRTWSPPQLLNEDGYLASLAVADDGTLYAAWMELSGTAVVTRSTDGGAHFEPTRTVRTFVRGAGWKIPAQRVPGVSPLPMVAVDRLRDRVYVSFSDKRTRAELDVYVQALSGDLTPIAGPKRVTRLPRRPADRFLPAIAVDSDTGHVWVCYYDTAGSRLREGARFTCTRSTDRGRTWATPVRAASRFSYEGSTSRRVVASRRLGDYEGLVAAGGTAHPVWTDSRLLRTPRREEIFAATLR